MPQAIAKFLRYATMALITSGAITGVQEWFNGTIEKLIEEIKDTEGVTEQEAKDILYNICVDLAINFGTVLAVIWTKSPTKGAQLLGLTSGVAKKRVLSKTATVVATNIAKDGGTKVVTGALPKILKAVAIPGSLIWLVSAVANIIEPGIYKPEQTNAVYKKLGIPFQYPQTASALKPGPFSSTSSVTFNDYATSLEAQNVKGFSDPFAKQSRPYSRQALADLINGIYGESILNGKALSVKELTPLVSKYIISDTKVATTSIPKTTSVSVSPITKVFTGIVSQGVVGQGLVFEARPDDMIDSAEELRQAAANNLAPYLNTLLGKIVYEVKVVSSIITKEGFKQSGTTQRIQTGTDKFGNIQYKTVTNKFATLTVYALTDKGSRAKLTTIVLGPTNAAKLTIGQNDLRALETQLPADVTTSDIKEIKGIETAESITVSTPPPVATQQVTTQTQQGELLPNYWNKLGITDERWNSEEFDQASKNANKEVYEMRLKQGVPFDKALRSAVSVPVTGPVVSSTVVTQVKAGANATTLYDWYQAQGQNLPSVSVRSQKYAELGLGQASYYTGTAEQNTKLLNALKSS